MRQILTLMVLCTAMIAARPVDADQARLFSTIGERLGWMVHVAAWKHENQVPIEDLAREALVLDAATAQAAEMGLAPDSVRAFFQAQITAAKDIQTCWIDRWNAGAPLPENPPDLVENIRPQLIHLGRVLIEELAQELAKAPISLDAEAQFLDAATIECLTQDARVHLFEGLMQVQLAN